MVLQITDTIPAAQPYRDEELDGRIGAAGLAGATLEHGLLRFHTADTGPEGAHLLGLHFAPGRTDQWVPFAVDWLGRQYCRVREQGVDTVVRVDPVEFQPEQVVDFAVFLNTLLEDPAAARSLGAEECAAALAGRGIPELPFDTCFGCILPPFAGGERRPDNMLDLPTRPYWAAMADVKNQWEHRPAGAFAVGVAHRDAGLSLVFDVDQDPEFSPGAGTRAERLELTSSTGPAVYNYGLARELTASEADEIVAVVQEAFGLPAVGHPLLVDWRARCYLREQGDGADVVVRCDPATMTRTVIGEAEDLLRRLAGADPSLLELFEETEKSRQCARLRLTEIPAGDALVPPAPPSVAGPEAADPARFRLMPLTAYWWIAGSLTRTAAELAPETRLQGYLIDPDGRMGLQHAAGRAPSAPPSPWEDTAGVPPTPLAPWFTALEDTGMTQTGLDEDRRAPGEGEPALLLAWYGLPGRVYNRGLFRFLGFEGSAQASEHLREAFGPATADAVPVLVDWLGRYGVHEIVDGMPRLVSYDVTRDEREDLCGFADGIQRILLTPVALDLFDAEGFGAAQEALGLQAVEPGMCVGVKVPPFLGGTETLENREHDRLDVHWMWHGRVLAQARAMPAGARVQGVEMTDDGRPVLRVVGPDGAPVDPRAPETTQDTSAAQAAPKPKGFFGRMFKG